MKFLPQLIVLIFALIFPIITAANSSLNGKKLIRSTRAAQFDGAMQLIQDFIQQWIQVVTNFIQFSTKILNQFLNDAMANNVSSMTKKFYDIFDPKKLFPE